jgi:hypothetical protein
MGAGSLAGVGGAAGEGGVMIVVPLSLKEANDFVECYHRHNGRTSRDSGKFAIGASTGTELIGVAIVGRPLARLLQDGYTAEVLRCCVVDHAPKGSCSFLYSRCWRIWAAMGGHRLVTYTLDRESGSSLRGSGYKVVAKTKPAPKGWGRNGRERDWQPIYGQQKFRWEID